MPEVKGDNPDTILKLSFGYDFKTQ